MPPILFGGLFILSLIWGTSFLFIKVLLTSFSPIEIVFFRSLFGLIVIIGIMLFKKQPIIPKKTPWIILFLVGLFNSVLPWSLIGYSETMISSSMASILNATTPIWTLLMGILIFSTKTTRFQWIGIVVGFIGIFILLDIDITQLEINNLIGFSGVILATLFYGLSSQMSKRYFKDITAFQIAFFTLLTAFIVSGPIIAITGSFHWSYLTTKPTTILLFIGLGSFGSGIAYIIYYSLIQKGSAEFASLVTYLVPVTAVFWGITILGEELRPTMLIGLVLILLGVYISGRQKISLPRKGYVEKEAN